MLLTPTQRLKTFAFKDNNGEPLVLNLSLKFGGVFFYKSRLCFKLYDAFYSATC